MRVFYIKIQDLFSEYAFFQRSDFTWRNSNEPLLTPSSTLIDTAKYWVIVIGYENPRLQYRCSDLEPGMQSISFVELVNIFNGLTPYSLDKISEFNQKTTILSEKLSQLGLSDNVYLL